MGTIRSASLPNTDGPKYMRVADIIRREIASDWLKPGARLPPVRELAFQLGITPGTVARAYAVLTDERLLVGEVGRGTFVAQGKPEDSAEGAVEIDVIAHGAEHQDTDAVNMFSPHVPSVGQAELIRKLLARIAENPPSGLMHYPSRISSQAARQAAARWLSKAPIGPVDADGVVLTNGGQNAISLIFQALLRGRRPAVLVEELAYPGFRRAAELLRADVIPVAMDEYGVVPSALDAAARGHEAQVFCTSPQMHNPTLTQTPLERREELVAVARRRDLHILEDDCYRIASAHLPSYRMLAPERAWFVASISKGFTPALRVGFGVAADGRAADLRRASEHGFFGVATPIADLTAMFLDHPQLDAISNEVQSVLARYVRSAVNILGAFDLAWREDVAFLWLTLPPGWRAGAFCRAAEAQGVQIRTAEDFACRHSRSPHAVRLAVNAGVRLEKWEGALNRLRRLLEDPPEQIAV